MSIFQRGDGRWCAKVKDETHRPHRWVQRTFKTRQEAEQYEDEWKADSRDASRLTVAEAVTLYLKHVPHGPVTEAKYIWMVCGAKESQKKAKQKVGYAECIADKYVDALTRRDLEMVRDCARDGGASNASINMWTAKLNAAFRWCASEEYIPRNPWDTFRQLKATHGSRQGTLEQLQAMFPHLPAWLQWAAKTAMALCLRPGLVELFRLKWSAFDFAHGAVTVFMGKVGRAKTVFPIAEYMAEARERFRLDGEDKDLYVCRGSRGQTVYGYHHSWRKAAQKAGVEPFPMYGLRHIAASAMIAAGADIAAVAANLGHSSPQITLQAYAHALPSAQKAASRALGAAWCGKELPEPAKSGT